MNHKPKKNRGFTLVELIIVVAVLAILVGLLAPSYTQYVKKSKITKCGAQREGIERAYTLACLEDSTLSGCMDTMTLETVTGGNPIGYLAEHGYLEKGEAKCPVHRELYKLRLQKSGNHVRPAAICPCVETVYTYIEQAQKLWDSGNFGSLGTNKKDTELIKQFYADNGNTLPEVSGTFKTGTYFENQTLYWRPYIIREGKGKTVLYASSNNSGTHDGWNAGLVYVDGKVYQSTKVEGDTHKQGNIASLNKVGGDYKTVDEWAQANGFELVS